MKKTVRLLSVIMVIAMVMSMVGASAFAIVPGTGSGSIQIGGNSNDANASGSITIGGDDRPSDASAYAGPGYAPGYDEKDEEQKDSMPLFTVPTPPPFNLGEEGDEESEGKLKLVDVYGADVYDLVRANAEYIEYIRSGIENGTASQDEIDSACMLFGEDIIFGVPENESAAEEVVGENDSAAEENLLVEAGKAAHSSWMAMYTEATTKFNEVYSDIFGTYVFWNDGAEEQIDTYLFILGDEAPEDLRAEFEGINAYFAENKEAILAYLTQSGKSGKSTSFNAPAVHTTYKFEEVIPGYKSLAQALALLQTLNFNKTFDICNSSSYRITVDLQLKSIYSPAGGTEPAFDIKVPTNSAYPGNKGSITFTRGYIYGEGFAVEKGAILNLGGLFNNPENPDLTVKAGIGNAVYVNGGTLVVAEGAMLYGPNATTYKDSGTVCVLNGGTVYVNGGQIFGSDREAIHLEGASVANITSDVSNIKAPNYAAVLIEENSTTYLSAGTVEGLSGIALSKSGTLNMTGGRVFAKGAAGNSFPTTGAAVLGLYESATSASPAINIAGGELYAYNTNAIICTTNESAVQANRIKAAKLSDENIIKQENGAGSKSDYAVATVMVNGIGFASLSDAINAINGGYDDDKATFEIRLLTDYPSANAAEYGDAIAAITGGTKPIIINGDGHELRFKNSADGFEIDAGSVTIKNMTMKSEVGGTNDAVYVTGGSVYVGGNVTIKRFGGSAVHTEGGAVTVNDVMVDDATGVGINAQGGETTVVMCKIDCDKPVQVKNNSREYLQINGGWFLKDKGADGEDISTYLDKSVSEVKYVKEDKYYEVHLISTPEIKVNSSGVDASGKPYIIVNKANGQMDPLIFTNVSPEIESIYAVPYDGKAASVNIAEALRGYKGQLKIEDKILQKLPAGVYDLVFTFLDSGYVVKDKLSLVVYPAVATIYSEEDFKAGRVTAQYRLSNYDVNNPKNIAIVVSELPNGMALGNDAEGLVVTELYNYQRNNSQSWEPITSGPLAGNYVYYVSYADVNNLTPGQNYVYVQYGDITAKDLSNVATMPLGFTMSNPNVYITPSSINWSNISNYATFRCFPEPLKVYIDGYEVDHGYWDYNNIDGIANPTLDDVGKLRIKSSYLNTIPGGDHELTVVTNSGKLVANIHTGAGIQAKDIDYHVYGGTRSLTFAASNDINYDLGITIGSANAVNVDNFIIRNNNREFTLSANYLNRLALGTYTISAYVKTLDANGNEVYQKCNTTFRVISASEASYNPGTGDDFNAGLWIAILGISAVVLIAIAVPFVKKSKAKK